VGGGPPLREDPELLEHVVHAQRFPVRADLLGPVLAEPRVWELFWARCKLVLLLLLLLLLCPGALPALLPGTGEACVLAAGSRPRRSVHGCPAHRLAERVLEILGAQPVHAVALEGWRDATGHWDTAGR